jgi:hypothetical protein
MPLNNFSRTITWSNFSSVTSAPSGQSEYAQIHPDLSYKSFTLARKGKGVTITDVEVNIEVVKADSWVVESKKTDYLLAHEQGHYDILALSAREFYNSLNGLSGESAHDLETQVNSLRELIAKKVSKVDERYDHQTKNSGDQDVQKKWARIIASEKAKSDGSIDNLPA